MSLKWLATRLEIFVFMMSQVQRYLALPFFLVMMTGIFYHDVKWHLQEYLGINVAYPFTGMIALFVILLLLSTIVGIVLVYGVKIWRHQVYVTAIKHNPYALTVYPPRDATFIKEFWVPLLEYFDTGDKESLAKAKDTIDMISKTGKIKYIKKFDRVL